MQRKLLFDFEKKDGEYFVYIRVLTHRNIDFGGSGGVIFKSKGPLSGIISQPSKRAHIDYKDKARPWLIVPGEPEERLTPSDHSMWLSKKSFDKVSQIVVEYNDYFSKNTLDFDDCVEETPGIIESIGHGWRDSHAI